MNRDTIDDLILELFARRGAEAGMGAPMTQAEIGTFESSPYLLTAIQFRQYDDDGKVAGFDIKPDSNYRHKLESLLQD